MIIKMTFSELLFVGRELRKLDIKNIGHVFKQAYAAGQGNVCALADCELKRRGFAINNWVGY